MTSPDISVVVCTHNPRRRFFQSTLAGLRAQTLPLDRWELVIVDNASDAGAVTVADANWHPRGRVVPETTLGLTAARMRGIAESHAAVLVFADDDNVLAPDYLAHAARLAGAESRVGAWGGRIHGDFESAPAAWQQEFLSMLALRDLGSEPIDVPAPDSPTTPISSYPEATPLGAGMVIRRAAIAPYADALAHSAHRTQLDRRGATLTSGGDNDIILTALRAGWDVGYRPELRLTHLIPRERLTTRYLGRLRRGIFRSWVAIRRLHGLPVPPTVARWTLPFRRASAWWRWRAWRGEAAWVHWNGDCGDLEGRADLNA